MAADLRIPGLQGGDGSMATGPRVGVGGGPAIEVVRPAEGEVVRERRRPGGRDPWCALDDGGGEEKAALWLGSAVAVVAPGAAPKPGTTVEGGVPIRKY